MRKLVLVSVFVAVTGIIFTLSTAADFNVIPVKTNKIEITSTIVPKTGQTGCWDRDGGLIDCSDTGQDGEYQMGNTGAVAPSGSKPYTVPNWEGKRFTDNNDGTVTDNLTGLVWLKNANCFSNISWPDALSNCNGLASGSYGLTDGSAAGDWRLPNFNELYSLVDPGENNPALPNGHPFTDVQFFVYWSSTTYEPETNKAWRVYMSDAGVDYANKANSSFVWPVRSDD